MDTFQAWEPIAQRLTPVLLHFLWQGLVIALALSLIVRLCRVRSAEWRYCFSLAALFAMLTAPIVTLMIVEVSTRPESMAAETNATPISVATPVRPVERNTPPLIEEPAFERGSLHETGPVATPGESNLVVSVPVQPKEIKVTSAVVWQQCQPWIAVLWTAGVVLLNARLLIGCVGIWRLRRRGLTPPDWLVDQLQQLAADLCMTCPELRLSCRVSEAIALGFLRPMVLLPAAWVTQMPPDMLEAVLAHELAHIRRHDLWINLLQRVVETLLFYHPAVWWLSRRLRMERELCCDELVVQMTQNPLRYAETLEHIGRLSLRSTPVNLTVSIIGTRSILSDRIRHILRLRPQEQSSWAWLAGVLPLMLAGVLYWSAASVNDTPVHADDEIPAESLTVDGPIADEQIAEVRITGNVKISEEEIRKHIKIRPGHEFDSSAIKDNVRNLIRTRWFSHVEPTFDDTDKGVVLTFKVLERPLVRTVEYKGNQKVKAAVLDRMTLLKPGQPYDVSVNRECVRRIQDHYKEKGFPFATVELERGDVQDDADCKVVFQITEGPKVKVSVVVFDDAQQPDDAASKDQPRLKTRRLQLTGQNSAPDAVNDEMDAVRLYYRNQGYFDAQIVHRLSYAEDNSKVIVNYDIDEGPRYRIDEIRFSGQHALSDEQLREVIKVTKGQEYSERRILEDVEAIRAKYGSQGRLFAKVEVVPQFTEQPAIVNLIFRIDEDKVYRVRRPESDGHAESPVPVPLVADNNAAETRRLTITAADANSPMTVRVVDGEPPYRQRGEYAGGVKVLLEDSAQKWQMTANRVLVETDSDTVKSKANPDQTIRLESDKYVLSTKPPLKMTLSGNVTVSCLPSKGAATSHLKADHVVIDFQRQQIQAERVQFRSDGKLFEGDRLFMTFAAMSPDINAPKLILTPGEKSPKEPSPALPAKLKQDELPRLREQRQQNNDRELAKALVGEWVMDLPAGASFPVTITQRDEGCVTVSNARNLSGTFACRGKRLKLVESSQDGIEDLIWEQQPGGWFKLIHEYHTVGAKYVGATLSKEGILSCAGIERQLAKSFPKSQIELQSSPQSVIVLGLARDNDERSRIMAAVVSNVNELQRTRNKQGIEVIDKLHFPPVTRSLGQAPDWERVERKLGEMYPKSKVFLIPFGRKLVMRGVARDLEDRSHMFNIVRGEVINAFGSEEEGGDAIEIVNEVRLPNEDVMQGLQRRGARINANDREAASNLAGRWLLTLPSQELFDVELKVSDDGCLTLACRKECRLVGRYALSGGRLELVEHASKSDIDLVWQTDGSNALKLTNEHPAVEPTNIGAKLERITAVGAQANVFPIPSEVLTQTRELAAAYCKSKGSLKARRPAGLEDLESSEAIKRAVVAAMLMLADPQKESAGLTQLRYLGDEAFDALVAGSKSDNLAVSKWSCVVLQHRGAKAVAPLSDALKSSPYAAVRSAAASSLGQTYRQAGVPALIAALDDPDAGVRGSVINIIRYPRDSQAIEPLQRFVNDPGMGHVAAESIRHIQKPAGYAWWPPETLDLQQLCEDAHTLKGERYGDVELQRLTAGLKSEEGTVTYHCLFALGHLGSTESVSAIVQAPLSEMKFHVLAQIGTPEAIDYLIQRLHSRHAQTRDLAISGLANGGDRWAAPILMALLDDPSLKVAASKIDYFRPGTEAWPESHKAHSALYSLFSRFGLKMEWRNLYLGQSNNVPDEITNLKAWWKQYGTNFLAGKVVPSPNLSTVMYNDP